MTPKKSPTQKTSGSAQTPSLATRVTAAPQVLSPEAARSLLERDLAGALAQLEPVFAEHPQVRSVGRGIAEGSPYLWDLIRANPGRFTALLSVDPERHLASILARGFAAVDATQDEAEAMRSFAP